MINLSLRKFSMLFFPIKITHLLYRIFKDMKLSWLILFSIDEFFRLESVICKKYTNTCDGMDSNYTNAINISII